jgi:glycosyltransferase involved in cell wall biosynthesis
MKVVVVNNCVPFVRGGAEHLADALVTQLHEHGHRAQLVRLPFRWDPPEKIAESMLAAALVEIDLADLVIGLKFPAYHAQHDTKVLWLLHQFRDVYDLWNTPMQGVPATPEVRRLREAIIRADNRCFASCRAIFTNSPVTSDRLLRYNGFDSTVLWPPLRDPLGLESPRYEPFVFAGGRVNGAKRQHLAVEAMRYARSGIRLVVAGAPETPADEQRLRDLVARHGLEDRVELVMRYIGEDEKREYLGGALACLSIPWDEDSYSYVALEALSARKAVVTTEDAGGVRLLVDDGVTGLVVPPEPRELGGALDRLARDPRSARRMGEAGHERLALLGLSWARVVEALVGSSP